MIIRLVIALSLGLIFSVQAQEVVTKQRAEALNNPPETLLKKDISDAPGSTIIEADQEASFNAKEKLAVFVGNVRVRDPQFDLDCEKLTIEMNNEDGGLKKAIAEGKVTIVQEKISTEDGKRTRSTGRAQKAIYDTATGDITLVGWPEVAQGINVHKASEQSTRMILNRDGRLKTFGKSITTIQDNVDTPQKKQ